MNISQHAFVPLVQKNARTGYYNSGGQLLSSDQYRSYPIQTYPASPLIHSVQAFSDMVTTKLRTWNSTTTSSQTTSTYTETPAPLTDDVVKWTASDGPDQYNVMLIFY